MRYFKYHNTQKTENVARKEEYKRFTAEEKRLTRKNKFLSRLTIVLFFLVFGTCLVGSGMLISMIPPTDGFMGVINYILEFILGLGAFIISLAIGILVCSPLSKKIYGNRHNVRRDVLSAACEHLRVYYGYREPCLLTKCYDSSDKKFKNHDVCIFVTDGELRITTDLKKGFIYGDRDLGCYAFNLDEIRVSHVQCEKYTATELETEEMMFLLGRRAEKFIKDNFIGE